MASIYVGITALNRSAKIRVPAVTVTNEVQTITVDATGGTFTVTYSGQTTIATAFNAAAAVLQNNLTNLSNLREGDVVVTGGPGASGGGTPYTLTFGGTLAGTDVAAVTTGAGSLTGGASTAVVATGTAGSTSATAETLLVPGTVTVVDLGDTKTRKALNSHAAIGQWTVVEARATSSSVTLPPNS